MWGIWAVPGETEGAKVGLMLHGWTGPRGEVGGLFEDLAARLAAAGVVSLRIDFRGERARNGPRLTSTFAMRIADAEAGLAYARERWPDAKVGVVGFSLGGAKVLALVGRQTEAVASLVLWSTAADPAVDFFTDAAMQSAVRQAMKEGAAQLQRYAPLQLTREHVAGFLGCDLLGPLAAYRGTLLGIRSKGDFLPRYEDRIMTAAGGTPKEAVVIGGADPIFNVLEPAISTG